MNTPSSHTLPRSVAWLGYGGLLPFIALTLLIVFDHSHWLLWNAALIAYAAVILSFVGALHWAFAMLLPQLDLAQRRNRFIWSTIPALIAWPATMLDLPLAVALLVAGFAIHYQQDRQLAKTAALPGWYLPLRLHLSSLACTSLATAAAITLFQAYGRIV